MQLIPPEIWTNLMDIVNKSTAHVRNSLDCRYFDLTVQSQGEEMSDLCSEPRRRVDKPTRSLVRSVAYVGRQKSCMIHL